MYGKAIPVRGCAVIVNLTSKEAHCIITGKNTQQHNYNNLCSEILDEAILQIQNANGNLPSLKSNDRKEQMTVVISLTRAEAEKIVAKDGETENRFIKIVSEQSNFCRKLIEAESNRKNHSSSPRVNTSARVKVAADFADSGEDHSAENEEYSGTLTTSMIVVSPTR